MGQAVKSIVLFFAANIQALTILWLAQQGIAQLELNYPWGAYWKYVLWPLALVSLIYNYYKIIKALLQLEKNGRNKLH